MLPASRLLSFINHQSGFTVSFLEGSRLIHDLALLHAENVKGFSYLRDFTLLGELLSSYLKHGESMGIFIDCENPYLRLKLEISSIGKSRTLLLPEELDSIPESINGYCRLVKSNPHRAEPYTSFIKVENLKLSEAISLALKKSFQVDSLVLASETSDQSLMLSRLPDIQVDKENRADRPTTQQFFKEIESEVKEIFALATSDEGLLLQRFKDLEFDYISGLDMELSCNCEKDRMVSGIASLAHSESLDGIFEKDSSIEVKCDYCKKRYLIKRTEVESFLKSSDS